jgi:hypothetical protein
MNEILSPGAVTIIDESIPDAIACQMRAARLERAAQQLLLVATVVNARFPSEQLKLFEATE